MQEAASGYGFSIFHHSSGGGSQLPGGSSAPPHQCSCKTRACFLAEGWALPSMHSPWFWEGLGTAETPCGSRQVLRGESEAPTLRAGTCLALLRFKSIFCDRNTNAVKSYHGEELTHRERPCCWERLKAGEGDDRGRDGRMASPTRQTRV